MALAALLVAGGGGLGCGGGEEAAEVDLAGVEEVVAGALRAISPPGKVGHLTRADESRVQEFWVDGDNGRFRSESRPVEGEEGWFTVTVGEDWRIATYQSDMAPFPIHITAVDREEAAALGIENFAYYGAGPFTFLAWADERRVVGESTADGREVVVIEAKRAMDGDWQPGTVMVVTVELDKATLLPVQLRSKMIEPDGTETEEYGGWPQFEWGTLSPDDLPPDFFSPDALFALYSPVDEKLAQASKLDFSLFWLGEEYEGAAEGQLDLYLWDVDTERLSWPELRYAAESLGGGGEVVLIRQGPVGRVQFGPPPEMTGPIEQEQVTVQGRPATLYFKTDRPSPTYELTYRWLVLTLGGTTIELYPIPMSEEGQEINPLNNKEATLALAEALVPIPSERLEISPEEAAKDLYASVEEEMAQAQAWAQGSGFALYWPEERYRGEGLPELFLQDVWMDEKRVEASLDYAIDSGRWPLTTVVIRQGPAGQTEFGPLRVGPVPEEKEEKVTVQGEEAILYASAVPPLPGPCATEGEDVPCTPVVAAVPAYHRLVLTLGNTAIQVEAMAIVREGQDMNPFNNGEALMAVAEALALVPVQP